MNLSLLLALACAFGVNSTPTPASQEPTSAAYETTNAPPEAPTVTVADVFDDAIVFQVVGPDTIYGAKVTSIKIAYYSDAAKKAVEALSVTVVGSTKRVAEFSQIVKVNDLEGGLEYHFMISLVNKNGQEGPKTEATPTLLKPTVPDIEVHRESSSKLVLKWGPGQKGLEDSYEIAYEKSPGCGVTLSVSTCFGNKYSFDDLEKGVTYKFKIRSHNKSGYSKQAEIDYPVE